MRLSHSYFYLIISIATVSTAMVSTATIAQQQLGNTYSISETDALEEINKKANSIKGVEPNEIASTTAFQGYALPETTENKQRWVSPFYTLEFSITDSNENVLYPKGYTYNIAEYVKLPFRIIIFSEKQIEFIKNKVESTDILLLSEGNILEAKKKLQGNLFYLDEKIANRLYINSVPSILTQEGAQYKISELRVSEH